MSTRRILVIGSTNTDMVVETPHLPSPGETVLGGAFRMTPGGKGANQAVAAARAAGRIAFVTAVGDDTMGTEHRQRLAREGIDVSHLIVKHGVPTGTALILLDARGENMIAVAPGANELLAPEDLISAAPAFSESAVLLMQLEIPLSSVIWAAQYAATLHCRVLLNPAPLPAAGLPDELLACVDILTPNAGELALLAPGAATVEAAARAVLARGPRAVIVTLGGDGALLVTADETIAVPACPVTPVDTVGAGDCFSATLAVALVEGKPLAAAVRFATAAAALSTIVIGAQQAMPIREEIEQLIARLDV